MRLGSVIYVITPTLISSTQEPIIVLIKALSLKINVSTERRFGASLAYICVYALGEQFTRFKEDKSSFAIASICW